MSDLKTRSINAEGLSTFFRQQRQDSIKKVEITNPQLAAQMRAADERTSKETLDSGGWGNEVK